MRIVSFIRKVIEPFSGFLAHISMWGVFAMMLMVVVDVTMRATAGGRSLLFTEEVSGYLLVLVAYLAMAETLKQGRHIRVGFIVRRLPPRLRRGLSRGPRSPSGGRYRRR